MGFFSPFGRKNNQAAESVPQDDLHREFRALARELGLHFRTGGRDHIDLSGETSGLRVRAVVSTQTSSINVRFNSGLRDLSIRSRWQDLRTSRVDVPTGDEVFDASFRLLLKKGSDPIPVVDYLTPNRREAIFVLQGVVPIREIEEDDLEVRFESTPTSSELRQAIIACINAAKALDVSAPPQDQVLRAG